MVVAAEWLVPEPEEPAADWVAVGLEWLVLDWVAVGFELPVTDWVVPELCEPVLAWMVLASGEPALGLLVAWADEPVPGGLVGASEEALPDCVLSVAGEAAVAEPEFPARVCDAALTAEPTTELAVETGEPGAGGGFVAACACRENTSMMMKIPAATIASCTARRAMRRAIGCGMTLLPPAG